MTVEISDLQPNVLSETRYVMALEKPVVLLAKEAELSFDVHAHRCVRYESTPAGFDEAARQPARLAKAALEPALTLPGKA